MEMIDSIVIMLGQDSKGCCNSVLDLMTYDKDINDTRLKRVHLIKENSLSTIELCFEDIHLTKNLFPTSFGKKALKGFLMKSAEERRSSSALVSGQRKRFVWLNESLKDSLERIRIGKSNMFLLINP